MGSGTPLAARWYYRTSGKDFGPVTYHDLDQKTRSREILIESEVKLDSDGEWRSILTIAHLLPAIASEAKARGISWEHFTDAEVKPPPAPENSWYFRRGGDGAWPVSLRRIARSGGPQHVRSRRRVSRRGNRVLVLVRSDATPPVSGGAGRTNVRPSSEKVRTRGPPRYQPEPHRHGHNPGGGEFSPAGAVFSQDSGNSISSRFSSSSQNFSATSGLSPPGFCSGS